MKVANDMLDSLDVTTRVHSFRDINSAIFVTLYEGLCAEPLRGEISLVINLFHCSHSSHVFICENGISCEHDAIFYTVSCFCKHKTWTMICPDMIIDPQCLEDDVHNCQAVIDTLSLDVLNTSLSHITGQDVVRGDYTAIRNLLEVFSGLMDFILEEIAGSEALSCG